MQLGRKCDIGSDIDPFLCKHNISYPSIENEIFLGVFFWEQKRKSLSYFAPEYVMRIMFY